MQATKERHNLRTAHSAIARRADFDCNGTLRGQAGWFIGVGLLPHEYHDEITTATAYDDFYVVFSYATPIAWFANGKWTMPDVKYSVTTSRHQSVVKRGIANV